MLFMVIERLRNGDPGPVGERFRRQGRMLPEGVAYHASWLEPDGSRCFQVMEAKTIGQLQEWADRWADLADFEILPVVTSQQFWAAFGQQKTGPAGPDRSSL
jgi:hypothetical protein